MIHVLETPIDGRFIFIDFKKNIFGRELLCIQALNWTLQYAMALLLNGVEFNCLMEYSVLE